MKYENLITLKHKETGILYYTFPHWPHVDEGGRNCLSVTARKPDGKTGLVDYIPEDELEIVE